MIRKENRYDEYAYRITGDVASSVTAIEPGQWVTYDANGKLVISDGTKFSFINAIEKTTSRDNISATGKTTFYQGKYRLDVTNFNAGGTYPGGVVTPLKVMAGGVLTNWVTGTDKVELLVANAIGAPVGGYLTIMSV